MLCDEINTTTMKYYDDFGPVANAIRRARKFVLSADFAHAADGLIDNLKELEKFLPWCRLPFQECWFEVAQNDRPHFVKAGIKSHEMEAKPKRIGFLLQALDNNLDSWRAQQFWSFADPFMVEHRLITHSGSLMALVMSAKGDANECQQRRYKEIEEKYPQIKKFRETSEARRVELKEPLARAFCPDIADFGTSLLVAILQVGKFGAFMRHITKDWGGEGGFLFATLGLLNTKNVVDLEHVDTGEWNRKRRSDQRTFHSYHVIKIKRQIMRRMRDLKSESERRSGVRAHFVMGHFKTRRTGRFFWSPHLRGDMARGYAQKDYSLD